MALPARDDEHELVTHRHAGVTGGTTWQQVTTTATELFRATEDATDIQIEYRFDNLGVTAGPGIFTTTITWTTNWF
jgi:hypothetical protein